MQVNSTILSPNITVPDKPRSIDVIVIHDMEYPERPTGAEWCANYFAKSYRNGGPQASAHYMVDNDSIVQGVREKDIAWAAPGNNHNGIQIELAGYARQTVAEWNDAYSKAELLLAAKLCADICKRNAIPVKLLLAADLLAGKRGITTHAEVSKAWKRSNHTDPGVNFPMADFLKVVTVQRALLEPPPKVMRTHFQLVNNGKLIFESLPADDLGPVAERLRLNSFLHNHLRGIHRELVSDPDGSLQLKLVRKEVVK